MYALDRPAYLRVQLYDRAGRVVRTLFEGYSLEGRQSLNLDVSSVAPGVYFCRLETPGFRAVKKAVVAR